MKPGQTGPELVYESFPGTEPGRQTLLFNQPLKLANPSLTDAAVEAWARSENSALELAAPPDLAVNSVPDAYYEQAFAVWSQSDAQA